MKESGVPRLLERVSSHFGDRAFIIKLDRILQSLLNICFQEEQRLQGKDEQIVREIGGELEKLQFSNPAFAQLEVLRNYYSHKVAFDEADASELLRVTGEEGGAFNMRLGLETDASVARMIATARNRIYYWKAQFSNRLGINRTTEHAIKVIIWSYEHLIYQLKDGI